MLYGSMTLAAIREWLDEAGKDDPFNPVNKLSGHGEFRQNIRITPMGYHFPPSWLWTLGERLSI
jgi:hypothetical protein